MIKLTEQNTAKAIERSKALKPCVRYIADRIFDVQSSRNNQTYRVELFVINGDKFAKCSCKASEKSLVCYHITSAISVNFYRQNLKIEKQNVSIKNEEMNNALSIRHFATTSERRGGTRI